MPEDVKVGIITKYRGPHLSYYMKSLAIAKGVKQVVLTDPSGEHFPQAEELLRGRFPELKTYKDYSEMLSTEKPDMVLVTIEAHMAPVRIQAALESGAHVMCEKPSCTRAEDFEKLVKLADSKNLCLMLAMANRFAPPVQKAKELVSSGALGKLYSADFFLISDQTRLTRPSYQKSWTVKKAQSGGGHLTWLGIHWLDLVHYITGDRVQQVSGFARNVGGQPVETEDAETVSLQFKSGMVGTFHGGYYLPAGSMQSGFSIWGSKGWLRIRSHRGLEGSTSSFEWHSTHEKAPEGVQAEEPISETGGYEGFVQAAVDAARGVKPVPLTAEDSLAVLKVIFAAYRSSESGRAEKVE